MATPERIKELEGQRDDWAKRAEDWAKERDHLIGQRALHTDAAVIANMDKMINNLDKNVILAHDNVARWETRLSRARAGEDV